MSTLDELVMYQKLVEGKVEVFAVVSMGVNDYVIMPTYLTQVSYTGEAGLLGEAVTLRHKLDGVYNVTKVFRTEEEAVVALKDTRRLSGLGEYGNYLLRLYQLKYPELWI